MATDSQIEWTDVTWNPSTGCSKVSAGCKFCYAETMATRLKKMGSERYENEFRFTMHWDKVDQPLSWKKPRKIFVNSMSDLFHEDVSLDFIRAVFDVMQRTPRHRYQVLTKRPEAMERILRRLQTDGDYSPASHIWLGTSVEDSRVLGRLEALRRVPAGVRFLSCEPLIGPLSPQLDLTGISWVIVGGESGTHLWTERTRQRRALVDYDYDESRWKPRPDRVQWVRDIRDACRRQSVAFFFKQWGGATAKAGGRLLDGQTYSEFPPAGSSPGHCAVAAGE